MADDGYTLDQLHHMEADALLRYHALVNSTDQAEDHNEKLAAIWDEVVTYRELIADHETAQIAASEQAESDQSVADVIAVHVAADELAAQEQAQVTAKGDAKRLAGRYSPRRHFPSRACVIPLGAHSALDIPRLSPKRKMARVWR